MRKKIEETGIVTLGGKKYDAEFVKEYIRTHTKAQSCDYFGVIRQSIDNIKNRLGVECAKPYKDTITINGEIYNSEFLRKYIKTHTINEACEKLHIPCSRDFHSIARYLHVYPLPNSKMPQEVKIKINGKTFTAQELRDFLCVRTAKQAAADLGIHVATVRYHAKSVGVQTAYEGSKSQQPCWKCAKATNGLLCPWVMDGSPVKGWTAEKTQIWQGDNFIYSYKIKSCPLFEKDERS